MSNLSKRECEGMLLVGLIPLLVVAWNEINLSAFHLSKPRQCAVYHENAPAHLKCEKIYEQQCPYFHSC